MLQGKSYTLALDPGHDVHQRLAALRDALIAQGVYSGHTLFLQAPGMEDLNIGRWGAEECGVADIMLATSILIKW